MCRHLTILAQSAMDISLIKCNGPPLSDYSFDILAITFFCEVNALNADLSILGVYETIDE